MLKKELTPKTTAIVAGSVLLLCIAIGGGFRMMHAQKVQQEDARMNWQRDREMGVPDLGLPAGASEEEREIAKTKMMEKKMTEERDAAPSNR